VYCNGTTAIVVQAKSCRIPLSVLTAAPYYLLEGNSVFARIVSGNFYGFSPQSPQGNGALMVIVPDAPVNLINNFAVTNKAVIQFSWSNGVSDGGSPVLDYRVSFD
jgi:hypothetical protein